MEERQKRFADAMRNERVFERRPTTERRNDFYFLFFFFSSSDTFSSASSQDYYYARCNMFGGVIMNAWKIVGVGFVFEYETY